MRAPVTIGSRFADWARATPDAVAVESGKTTLSYAGLNSRANQLAHRLRAGGVGPGTIVGVCLDRSTDLIVALLAVLRAGGAYLPLDRTYPPARLTYMTRDSATSVIVTSGPLPFAPEGVDVVDLAEERGSIGTHATTAPLVDVRADSLAYAMYTSGSTGLPKAVLIEHRNVVNLCLNADYVPLHAGTRMLQLAPVAFDAATFEIWGALLNGCRLVLAPPGALATAEIAHVVRTHDIDTMWLTAALLERVVDDDVRALDPVLHLISGGDVLSPRHVRLALAAKPGRQVINGYGPTEATTFTCCHPMTGAADVEAPVPIGRPIRNAAAYVVDGDGRPVPDGELGELWIGGAGVGRGYLARPGLTAASFVPNSIGPGVPAGRLYRSGDLVRRRVDGVIEFHGRSDRQIKIRGHRVEPAEVEAALTAYPGLRQAVAVAATSPRGDARLVAYVVPDGSVPHPRELRRFLAARLPAHLIPALFAPLDHLPVTANGKTDRSRLPEPDWNGGWTNPREDRPDEDGE